jgi:signal transduction histidine kinase
MRVLILEDSAGDAELAALELRRSGLEPTWERAATETEYLAGLEMAPDVILADYHLPGLDAPRALRLLQERELDIPLIVLSGAIGTEEAVACLRHGAADVLLKDTLGRLAQAVTRALEARRVRRAKADSDAALREQAEALRRSEEQWRRLFDELQARFEAANASLEAAAARVTELHRLKGEVVSTVSHELRGPLNNLALYLDLLEAGKPEKRAPYMATMRREVHLMESLIEDILQLTRLDMGHTSPVLERVNAGRMLMELADDRRELVRQRALSLEACLNLNLPPVMADPRMLTEVLSNLLTNAINYTPGGGVIRLQGELREQDGRPGVALEVGDTGPGITSEDLPRIFERYYRGEAARRSGVPGTGLGLAISEEIIKRHGGRIAVESTVGQGSTFTVWLPALSQ